MWGRSTEIIFSKEHNDPHFEWHLNRGVFRTTPERAVVATALSQAVHCNNRICVSLKLRPGSRDRCVLMGKGPNYCLRTSLWDPSRWKACTRCLSLRDSTLFPKLQLALNHERNFLFYARHNFRDVFYHAPHGLSPIRSLIQRARLEAHATCSHWGRSRSQEHRWKWNFP